MSSAGPGHGRGAFLLLPAKLIGSLLLVCLLLTVAVIAAIVVWQIARQTPWVVPVALPMVAAYTWAMCASTPGLWLRILLAIAVQTATLLIVSAAT